MTQSENRSPEPKREKEFSGPAWKHPYAAFIIGTMVLFLFLMVVAYLAMHNDWIPHR